jgi:carbon-monoxide dehydrogenase medium subunit
MRAFDYIKPSTVAEAVSFLADKADDSLVLGGGTAAVVLLNLGILRPRYVVDIGGIASLRETSTNGALHLGALTTIRSLERDAAIQRSHGLLASAASQVANVRVRNVATVGGAVSYGEPQTDTPVALTALSATLTIVGASGERRVPIDQFYVGPYETVLAPGELVTGIEVPNLGAGTGGCHEKFTIGSPENKPVANVSALVTIDPSTGRCTEARIVMGAVGPKPVVAAAARGLIGETLDDDRIAEVAASAATETDPVDDLRGPVWYKRRITKVLVERALRCARHQANP